MSITLADVEARFDVTHLDHLDRQAEIPTVDTLGFQGDVAVIRVDGPAAATPVPAAGVAVVRGENGGNTHLLIGDAHADLVATVGDDLILGRVTVGVGATALLSHPEHGGLLIAPGTYEVRRQREQADEIRLVQD
jgi:hypothetical protein